jgi:hypothetical protein
VGRSDGTDRAPEHDGEDEEDVGLYAPRERYTRDLPPDAPPPPVPDTSGERPSPEPPAGADSGGPPSGA